MRYLVLISFLIFLNCGSIAKTLILGVAQLQQDYDQSRADSFMAGQYMSGNISKQDFYNYLDCVRQNPKIINNPDSTKTVIFIPGRGNVDY